MLDNFGLSRILEPKGTVPVTAWKLDNSREIGTNEARVRLELIDVDPNSFIQMCSQCDYDEQRMKEKIIDIVNKRGKLHNPFTDSGGVFYGKIEAMGNEYAQETGYKIGDDYYAQATLTAIPIYIEKIESIDFNYCQLYVKGYAIVFEGSIVYEKGRCSDARYILKALEDTANFYSVYNSIPARANVAIIGMDIMITMMYAGVLKYECAKNRGVTIIMDHECCGGLPEEQLERLLLLCSDEVIFTDLRNSMASLETMGDQVGNFDVVVNTESRRGAETVSSFLVKDNGITFFTNMTNGMRDFVLIAESMKRHIHTIEREQYFTGNDEFTDKLLCDIDPILDQANDMFRNVASKRGVSERMAVILSQYRERRVDDFIYASQITSEMVDEAINVAKYDCNVIIQGETGVGKEKVLEIIHANSERNNKPCIKVNCATIQESLAESEFFGYEAGAFTGAQSSGKKGYFELANNGILFLDEIGTLSMNMQSKLLRVLQESQFYRVGGTEQINVNVRVICANNVPIKTLVDDARFREDLYYRLNICVITVPPLRDRRDDITVLAKAFLERYNGKYGMTKEMDESAYAALFKYDWPGNVRELENTIHRIIINTRGDQISGNDVESMLNENVFDEYVVNTRTKLTADKIDFEHIIEEQEKKLCEFALKENGTTRQAADALGITQTKLMRMKKKYGL
jgi:Transcriptional regulator containing PAS, AAA-type ATPase, and DNA-binding domains